MILDIRLEDLALPGLLLGWLLLVRFVFPRLGIPT